MSYRHDASFRRIARSLRHVYLASIEFACVGTPAPEKTDVFIRPLYCLAFDISLPRVNLTLLTPACSLPPVSLCPRGPACI